MFTGIITHLGTITSLQSQKGGIDFTIKSDLPLKTVSIGSSIAIDGTCYTICKKKKKEFTVQAMEETTKRTISSTYKKNTTVNLELPLRIGDRLDGHFILGHVDFAGVVKSVKTLPASKSIEISSPSKYKKFITNKGSITCNGVSLTITKVTKTSFTVNLIPHTQAHTNLEKLKKGDKINIEIDTLARYIDSLLTNK